MCIIFGQALFYNLHTESVEDFVGGLEDLENGLSPLAPRPVQDHCSEQPSGSLVKIIKIIKFSVA